MHMLVSIACQCQAYRCSVMLECCVHWTIICCYGMPDQSYSQVIAAVLCPYHARIQSAMHRVTFAWPAVWVLLQGRQGSAWLSMVKPFMVAWTFMYLTPCFSQPCISYLRLSLVSPTSCKCTSLGKLGRNDEHTIMRIIQHCKVGPLGMQKTFVKPCPGHPFLLMGWQALALEASAQQRS